jgi:hypothetical protein
MVNGRASAGWKLTRRRVTRLTMLACLLTAFFAALSATKSVTAQANPTVKKYEMASVRAMRGLRCELHSPGTPAAKGIPLATDSDGYARFYAVRAGAGEARQWLVLSCVNSAGSMFSYPVNLASAGTFAARPLNLAAAPGKNRPPLTGNPMRFTEAQLIQLGYGLRPAPENAPAAYKRWLAAARVDGRMLYAGKPDLHSRMTASLHPTTATSQTAPDWAGTAITGAPTYAAVEGLFDVPTAIPGGDQTGTTEIAIWNGLGGFGTGSGLIQSGVNLYTTATAATYGSWREYCCGDPDSNGYGGNFTPSPGDIIYAENWYCDAAGLMNVNGGYGCSYLVDLTTGATLSCTAPNGSPCWSVPAIAGMTFGPTAEFIIENQSQQVSETSTAFTDFSPPVTMTGSAYSTSAGWESIGDDPSLNVLTDFTNTTSHLVVSTAGTSDTVFTMEPAQASYPLYCQGPLTTPAAQVPTPTTVFQWAATGAGTEPPGPGQCAWADRTGRGAEVHPGDTGVIFGYLNQVASLPAGQYSEVEVYTDPGFDDDLNVTQIVGLVSPPFSPNP